MFSEEDLFNLRVKLLAKITRNLDANWLQRKDQIWISFTMYLRFCKTEHFVMDLTFCLECVAMSCFQYLINLNSNHVYSFCLYRLLCIEQITDSWNFWLFLQIKKMIWVNVSFTLKFTIIVFVEVPLISFSTLIHIGNAS